MIHRELLIQGLETLGPVTVDELAAHIRADSDEVRATLNELVEEGLVSERVAPVYDVIEEARS